MRIPKALTSNPEGIGKGADLSERGWSDLHKRWARSAVPLRPHAQVVENVARQIADVPGLTLLLGVTPEYAALDRPIVATDWSAAMIGSVWPGNTPQRQVVQADWCDMPFAPASFAAAIGDGALAMTRWPDHYEQIVARLRDVVRPGGKIVLRCFCSPETPEALAALVDAVMRGEAMGFHAFKWRLAHAVMHEEGADNMPIRAVWDAFQRLFPDREALSRASGWSVQVISEIDDYEVSPLWKSFPTRAQLLALFPGSRIAESGDYEMADRCPLLVIECP